MLKSSRLIFPFFAIVLLLMVYLFTPFGMFKRVVFIYPLFFLWLLSTMKRKWMSKAEGLIVCIACIAFLHLFLSFQTKYEFGHFIAFNLPTALWILCFVYYKDNTVEFGRIVPLIFLMFLISSVLTIRANIILPGASRFLATGSDSIWADLRIRANALFCGGYDFIFAIPFLLFPLFIQWKLKIHKNTLLFWVTIASMIICIVVGSYFTSILLVIATTTLSLTPINKMEKTIVALFVFFIILLLVKDYLLEGLIYIGNLIDSPMLVRRSEQALYGTYRNDYAQSENLDRFALMYNAIQNIFESPIIGRLGGDVHYLPSGHSELLGYFEDFGLLGTLYLIFYWHIYIIIKKSIITQTVKRYFSIYYSLFIFFLIIDKFDVATGMSAVVLFISPMLFLRIDQSMVQRKIKYL